jgi:hypothetical protein
MKPFDLEKALAGEPVVTRDGKEVTDIAYFPTKDDNYKVCGILNKDCEWFTNKGFYIQEDDEHLKNLFMKEEIIESWVNLYQAGNEILTGGSYRTEELAKQKRDTKDGTIYIKTIKITNEL